MFVIKMFRLLNHQIRVQTAGYKDFIPTVMLSLCNTLMLILYKFSSNSSNQTSMQKLSYLTDVIHSLIIKILT